MAMPAYTPDIQAPSERLHYFHPFRIVVAALVIVGAYLGLVFSLGGHSTGAAARLALAVVLLLAAVGRTFLPRTLSADAIEIRWKQAFQPAQTVPRHDVVAIQYVTTARPGTPRYYFVNRDGKAVLWADRFTPARMASFASYLGIPMRPVSVAPATNAAADAAVKQNAIVGSRRTFMVAMAVCALVGLAGTVGAAWWTTQSRAELAAYRRAPLCEQASADPLACRFDVPAVVTDFSARGHIDIRFPADVPTFHHSTSWVRLGNGAQPDPPFAVGDTVQIEVWNGYLLAINGAATDELGTLTSNSSWLLVAGAGFFLVVPLMSLLLGWKGPDSWFMARSAPAAAPKSILDNPPAVPDQPGPKEKPGAIERFPVRDVGGGGDDGWPTLVSVPDFDYARYNENLSATGIPESGERLLAKAAVHYYGVAGPSSILLLTDRRLVVLGPTRLEIPRGRISLLAYWTVRDSIAVTYQTMSGPHGILFTGPQLVLTGGPKTDMHRLFETMQIAFTNPDGIREPLVIVRPIGAWGRGMVASSRLSHRLWLAWVG
jgi:hypothetical protein